MKQGKGSEEDKMMQRMGNKHKQTSQKLFKITHLCRTIPNYMYHHSINILGKHNSKGWGEHTIQRTAERYGDIWTEK